ncbi:MAG: hypothetical protein OHK0039_36120 [Bacteroidia bacterium]
MPLQRLAWVAGIILGLTGVVSGALGAHALESRLSPDQLDSYETAVRFQMYHALLFVALAIAMQHLGTGRWLRLATLLLLVGVILFSGSIYLLVLTPLRPGLLTPLGGLLLILGWAALLGVQWKKGG